MYFVTSKLTCFKSAGPGKFKEKFNFLIHTISKDDFIDKHEAKIVLPFMCIIHWIGEIPNN